MSRLYILGFQPPELLSEKPTEVPSNSPEERILEICSLTVARSHLQQSYMEHTPTT